MRREILIFDWGNTVMVDFGHPLPMIAWERLEWEPGAEQALRELSEDYTCCIASNAPNSGTAEMKQALEKVGADKYFIGFYTSSELGYEKPDIRFFEAVCRNMGTEPPSCILIGDNYVKDIDGAKKAGIKTVFYNRTGMNGEFPSADAVITSLLDLPEAIRNL
jgi:putative hydrolase of the HAD superfamily